MLPGKNDIHINNFINDMKEYRQTINVNIIGNVTQNKK